MTKPRVLVTGTTGFLGHALLRVLGAEQGPGAAVELLTPSRRPGSWFDLDDPRGLAELVRSSEPDWILHAAADSRMASCEADPDAADRRNHLATKALASVGPRVVLVSTDLVFDGRSAPYRSADPVRPLSAYGRSKALAEAEVLERAGLVVRLPLLFGRSFDGRRGATDMLRSAAAEGRHLSLFENEFRTPVHVDLAAEALVTLGFSGRSGVVHVAGPERVSRVEFAERFLADHGLELAWRAVRSDDPKRPADVSMESDVETAESLAAMLRSRPC